MKLARVRRFALSLPATTEAPHFHFTSFRVAGKIFATAPPDGEHLHVFVDEAERALALAVDPDFLAPLTWGRRVVGLRIALATARPAVVETLVRQSWTRKAPKRLLAAGSADEASRTRETSDRVLLDPMDAPAFAAYLAQAIPAYARDKIASGQWSPGEAPALARQGFDALLPDGLATPDNVLFTLRDPSTNADVGMLWYAVEARAGRRIAYVYDVLVEPRRRREGLGTGAFEALEAHVVSRGLAGIALHVFGHNDAARALYAKLGYRPTNISLFKGVAPAG